MAEQKRQLETTPKKEDNPGAVFSGAKAEQWRRVCGG